MVKAYVCKAAEWVTREAMQIHGGYGYAEEYPVSRLFVDARVLSIFEGADETLCLKVIARRLGLSAARSGRAARSRSHDPRPSSVATNVLHSRNRRRRHALRRARRHDRDDRRPRAARRRRRRTAAALVEPAPDPAARSRSGRRAGARHRHRLPRAAAAVTADGQPTIVARRPRRGPRRSGRGGRQRALPERRRAGDRPAVRRRSTPPSTRRRHRLDELVGRPWTVLTAVALGVARRTT